MSYVLKDASAKSGEPTWARVPVWAIRPLLSLGATTTQVYVALLACSRSDTPEGWSGSIHQLAEWMQDATGRKKRDRCDLSRSLRALEGAGLVWTRVDGRYLRIGLSREPPAVASHQEPTDQPPAVAPINTSVATRGGQPPAVASHPQWPVGATQTDATGHPRWPLPATRGGPYRRSEIGERAEIRAHAREVGPAAAAAADSNPEDETGRPAEPVAPPPPPPPPAREEVDLPLDAVLDAFNDVARGQVEDLSAEVGADEVARQLEAWPRRSPESVAWARTPWGAFVALCRQRAALPKPPASSAPRDTSIDIPAAIASSTPLASAEAGLDPAHLAMLERLRGGGAARPAIAPPPPPAVAAPPRRLSMAELEGQLLAMGLERGSAAWEATLRARMAAPSGQMDPSSVGELALATTGEKERGR